MHAKQRVSEIYNKHKDLVSLSCNEHHQHSASHSCLIGPKESLDVCFMYEYILMLEARLTNIMTLADTSNVR